MKQFFINFKNFFSPLNGAQRALFVLFAAGLISFIGFIFYWALTPSYAMLFGSLAPESANEIVEELRSMGVKYELRDNGKTVAVPRDKVYDLRLKFASTGVSGNDYKGYELFDQNALGMTDFMQRLNQRRALEGELSRTISNLEQVEGARIHIVIPERSPFQETTIAPSASVTLNMKRGQTLEKSQIEGIGALVSGSVEGLVLEKVVILDQNGNQVSDNAREDQDVAASSAQIKVRQNMESYLAQKGQTMLDRVVGPGNSILRVSTEHNFDKIVQESDIIDPESRIIISEERRTTRNAGQTQEPVQGAEEIEPFISNNSEDESVSQVRNYEVSKTREQRENGLGEITRISASLLLNLKKESPVEGEGDVTYTPYNQQELEEIRTIMSTALGISGNRGDEITVTQIRFQDPFENDPAGGGWIQPIPYSDIIKYVFLLIVLVAISVMVFRMSKSMGVEYGAFLENSTNGKNHLGAGSEEKFIEGQSDNEEDFYEKKLSSDARKKLKLIQSKTEELGNFIDEKPAEAAGLLRTLMTQKSY
ncbi:MAG: flagellar basal-body MS-ring/collar protein FliF [Balneolaceae bacterium]